MYPTKQERNYKCQRCLNHGKATFRNGHDCQYKTCKCKLCNLNNERRKINIVLRKNCKNNVSEVVVDDKNRQQHCTLCKNHEVLTQLKGHKEKCPFKDCSCQSCSDSKKHRRIMAEQMKNRRKQHGASKTSCSPKSSHSGTPKTLSVARPEPIRLAAHNTQNCCLHQPISAPINNLHTNQPLLHPCMIWHQSPRMLPFSLGYNPLQLYANLARPTFMQCLPPLFGNQPFLPILNRNHCVHGF